MAFDFMHWLGANVVVDYHEQHIRYPGNDTVKVVFDNLGFHAYGNCQERSSSPSGIMQIVTLAVRYFCACIVCSRVVSNICIARFHYVVVDGTALQIC